MTRHNKTPAERATARLQQATRIAARLSTATEKAKANAARLDAELEAASKRRDHYRTDPDLPSVPVRHAAAARAARKSAAAVPEPRAATGGEPDAATG